MLGTKRMELLIIESDECTYIFDETTFMENATRQDLFSQKFL